MEGLGKVENDAVFRMDDVEQESDEESETDDGDDDKEFEAQSGEKVDERGIN